MLLTQWGSPQLSHNFSGSSNSGISAEFPYLVLTSLPSLIRQRNHLLIPRVPELGGTHSLIRSNYIVGWYQGWLIPCPCLFPENGFRVFPLLVLPFGQFLGQKFSYSFSIYSFISKIFSKGLICPITMNQRLCCLEQSSFSSKPRPS